MISTSELEPLRIRHVLSTHESQLEQSILSAMSQRRAAFSGSPRDGYEAMTAMTPLENGVSIETIDSGSVRGCWVRPANPSPGRALLFLHGGAYALGSAKGYCGFASQMTVRTGIATFVLDYSLAPEHRFPAAYNDTIAAITWLESKGITQLSLVGDSAGGGLALAALRRADRGTLNVASVAVFSPWTDLSLTGASFSNPATHDPVFQPQILANAATTYLGTADPTDGRASPLHSVPDVLPPIAIQVGTDELLFDDSTRYAAAAAQKGGEVRIELYEGLHHVFQRCVVELPAARKALDAAAAFVSAHWS